MPRVLVIHRDPAEAAALAGRPRRDGFEATGYPHFGSKGLRQVRSDPPDAIVIDLTALPSYGKAMAALLRESKGTRHIPLVFINGDPEKMPSIREAFPDVVFTNWARVGSALRRAIARQPAEPVVPKSWSGPLVGKLRIREHSVVALRHPPDGFATTLGELPAGARLQRDARHATVLLIFAKSAAALGRELPVMAREARKGLIMWVLWPKRSSKAASDLNMPRIQEMCAAVGLVGYKICSVDETWSAIAIGRAANSPRFRSGTE